MVAMAVMAGFQVASSYFAAQNVKDTAELNQDIADMNAEFAELDAYDAEVEGYTNVAKYQSIVDQTLAQQQAALTAADVDVSYGSAAEIRKETEFIAELNRMEIEEQAREQALGYKRQARDYRLTGFTQYTQAQAKASSIQTQGLLAGAKTGVSGYGRGN